MQTPKENVTDDLIFDVGMHKGEDTKYYLSLGFRVLAVDADPNMIELAKKTFVPYLSSGRLALLNVAISDKDDQEADLYISEQSEWNSLKRQVSDRKHSLREVIRVKTRTLPSIMSEFGVPHYCKIDIEGYDSTCLQSLSGVEPLPEFISVESECLGEHEKITEEQALETLVELKNLGYSKFKLVRQEDLTVLERENHSSTEQSVLSRPSYNFPRGSTGPFGNFLDSEWLGYEAAKKTLLYNRRRYFKFPYATNYGFWCDWHAGF